MRSFVFTFCLVSMCLSSFAEMRLWKTVSGEEYKAEFVRELFDKLTLRLEDGTEVRIPVPKFSEHDQKYLRVMVPPVMEADVQKFTNIKDKRFDDQYDQDRDVRTVLSTKVSIAKESKRPFTSRLKAEIYLIGQEVVQTDYYMILSRTESSFLLGEHNDNTHVFKTAPIELQVYTEYDRQRRGPVYVGYVLVVSDASGNTVQVFTDIDWLAEKVPQLRELYKKGAASVYSRYFDKETVTKQPVPRPVDRGTARMH